MKWSNEYKVHYYYTDYNNILKPGYIGRYMQETAWNALKTWGPAPSYLKEKNLAFILSKISFKYYEQIYEDDTIKVETWANPPKMLMFPRNYRIYKDGKTAVEAASSWVLMDVKEKNILRPDALDSSIIVYDAEELDFTVQKRFKMPETAANNINNYSEYKVKSSDIDTYFHMNNVAYIDLICDNLFSDDDIISTESRPEKRLISLDLNYNAEARFAQIIGLNKNIITHEDTKEEEYFIRANLKDSGNNCFEAKVVLTTGFLGG